MDRFPHQLEAVPAVIRRGTSFALDVLYPATCIACETDGVWFCTDCQREVKLYANSFCPGCGAKRGAHDCPKAWPFASVISCGSYAQPTLRQVITSVKYRSATCLTNDVKSFLKRFRQAFLEPWPWAGLEELIVTSVPGDRDRIRRRGLDHAAILADAVRDILVPWAEREPLLERTRAVEPNANLPASALRYANVQNAFRAIANLRKPVLLVDDVLTTGATAVEAAKALIAAGASEIHLFTIAKG